MNNCHFILYDHLIFLNWDRGFVNSSVIEAASNENRTVVNDLPCSTISAPLSIKMNLYDLRCSACGINICLLSLTQKAYTNSLAEIAFCVTLCISFLLCFSRLYL